MQPHLAEADKRPQAADEALLLGQVRQHIHDLAVHQAEIAAVQGNIQVADGPHQPIESCVGQAFEQPFLAFGADRVDDVVALPPEVDELAEHLGRILQVAVHDDDAPSARVLDASADRRLVAEIAAEVQDDNIRVARLDGVEQGRRAVAAAVIDEHQLIGDVRRPQRERETAVDLGGVLFLVVERNDHTQLGRPFQSGIGRQPIFVGDRFRLGRQCHMAVVHDALAFHCEAPTSV